MLRAGPNFACQHCYNRGQECEQSSDCYKKMYKCQLHSAANPPPPLVPCTCHVRRLPGAPHAAANAVAGPSCQSHLPVEGEHWHTTWDQQFNTPSPAYDLLVGRTGYFAGLDSLHTALFWHSELKDAEALLDAAYRCHNFHCTMLIEALGWCMVLPLDDASCSKHVKFLRPTSPSKGADRKTHCDKGKRCTDSVVEEPSWDKGKGHADRGIRVRGVLIWALRKRSCLRWAVRRTGPASSILIFVFF
jgi:hypothetical protein